MNDGIEGKVVLITGAGKGKGRALAEELSRRGASIAANDISPINLDEIVRQSNGKIRAYTEDIVKKVAIQAIIKQVEDDFGRIDILINHAAVEPHGPLLDMDEWDWHRVLDVNLTGAFLATQSAGRVMRAQGSGVIINIISADGSKSGRGKEADQGEYKTAYLASMYGLLGLTRPAAVELAPYGIHVHAVGDGLAEFERSGLANPSELIEAVCTLCNSSLNGQIVNLEAK
jgi:NAD(P)-dependent dehydrogenase (short-subunit alcohol dehydrogenase family)